MKNSVSIHLILIVLLFLLGWITLRGELLMLSFPLLSHIGFSLWYSRKKVHLRAERWISQEWVSSGTPIHIRVSVYNAGDTISELLLVDTLPEGVELLDGNPVLLTALSHNCTCELSYSIKATRGQYLFHQVTADAGVTTGLFSSAITLECPSHIGVKPLPERLEKITISPGCLKGFFGTIPSRQGGAGTEFLSLRNYQPGDSMRHINWRVAGRHTERLHTNTFQMERVTDVGIILDARSYSNCINGSTRLFEDSSRAAASLASFFLDKGNRVSLLVYGGDLQTVVPGYGKKQCERILRALSYSQTGHNYALKSLDYLPARQFPPYSQIVLISPVLDEDLPAIAQLHVRGFSVIVICPNTINFECKDKKYLKSPFTPYAFRLVQAERTFLLKRIRQTGVEVVDWHVEDQLASAVKQLLGRKQHLQGSRLCV